MSADSAAKPRISRRAQISAALRACKPLIQKCDICCAAAAPTQMCGMWNGAARRIAWRAGKRCAHGSAALRACKPLIQKRDIYGVTAAPALIYGGRGQSKAANTARWRQAGISRTWLRYMVKRGKRPDFPLSRPACVAVNPPRAKPNLNK